MAGHQLKERKQTSSSQSTRKAAVHAAKLKSRRVPKGRAAATKARLLDLTAELDSQMTDVHAPYAQVSALDVLCSPMQL